MRAVLIFLQSGLTGMRVEIFGDNVGPKAIADNPGSGSRIKQNDVKVHHIWGLICTGGVSIV